MRKRKFQVFCIRIVVSVFSGPMCATGGWECTVVDPIRAADSGHFFVILSDTIDRNEAAGAESSGKDQMSRMLFKD